MPEVAVDRAGQDAVWTEEAEALAERLLADALRHRGRREEAQGKRIARILDDPGGLTFIMAL
ncbi:MAG: hypothetical protein J2O47_04565, partial [Acidimicrobiaceae bacterium]|nr:hypothetical protein [Acidimicrobiaceae bacterium]